MIEFDCPECGNPMVVPDGVTGETQTCPNCGAALEIPDYLEDAGTEPDGRSRRSAYAPSQLGLTQLPSPKESWITSITPVVSGFVMVVMLYFGGIALHLWTSALFYHQWGQFWGLVAFFTPFMAEVVAVFACFWWHVWYYILAIALWFVSMGAGAFAEKEALPRRVLLFCGWICLVCILSVSFGHYAWRYSLGPTSRTATDQAQLEDCALAVMATINASDSDDPSKLASLVTAKRKLKDTIQSYDKTSLDELCLMVDSYLRANRSLQKDSRACMEEWVRSGRTSKFKISDKTKQALDELPDKVRIAVGANLSEEVEAAMDSMRKELGDNLSNLPVNWRELMNKGLARRWTIFGQTYLELLSRPMPPPVD